MEIDNEIPNLDGMAAAADLDKDINLDMDDFEFQEGASQEGEFIPGERPATEGQLAMAAKGLKISEAVFTIARRRKFGDKCEAFKFSEDEKTMLQDPLARCVGMMGGDMPEWMIPYKPVIDLGMAAGLVFMIRSAQDIEAGEEDAKPATE